MATYLKSTYIDGSLTVEGDLKVKNIDLSNADIPVLDLDNTYNSAKNKIVRTGNNVPAELRPSGLSLIEEADTGNNRVVTLQLASETYNGSNDPNPVAEFNITRWNSASSDPSSSTVLSIQANANTASAFKACVNGDLYLWNKATSDATYGNAPDYQWHFNEQ